MKKHCRSIFLLCIATSVSADLSGVVVAPRSCNAMSEFFNFCYNMGNPFSVVQSAPVCDSGQTATRGKTKSAGFSMVQSSFWD